MKDGNESEEKVGRRTDVPVPGLPEADIQRQTALEALQDLATILPVAVCVISGVYLLLLSPMFGGSIVAGAVTVVSGAAAGLSYASRYKELYPRKARELIGRLEQERLQLEEDELAHLRQDLQSGFLNVSSTDGFRIFAGLNSAYEQLQPALSHQRSTDPFSVSMIPALAEETYRRGLSVLSDALELMKVIRTVDKETLEKEVAQFDMDIEVLKDDVNKVERLSFKAEKRAFSIERLEMLNKLQLDVERLLYQAQRCEASLNDARVELAAVRAGSSKSGVDAIITALQGTLHHVQEVQSELKKLGY